MIFSLSIVGGWHKNERREVILAIHHIAAEPSIQQQIQKQDVG
jgi:hypothetical protein